MLALETFAFGPSSHSMGKASSALFARHQVSATTATALSPTRSTFFTPGFDAMAAASKLFNLPPKTGQSLIAAFSKPGIFRSMPKTCEPSSLASVSRRLTGLPASFQVFGSFSVTSAGGVSLAAAAATLPKLVLRPVGLCVIRLFAALHSAALTFHSLAAA